MRTPHHVDANPVTPRVTLRCFPLDMDRLAKVELRIAGFTRTNQELVLGNIIRGQVVCNVPILNGSQKIRDHQYQKGYRWMDAHIMTKRSRDCCRSTLISCMTSDIFSLATRVSVQNLAQSSTALSDIHFSNNSSMTPAVSSNTLSNVPLTSLATLLISGA